MFSQSLLFSGLTQTLGIHERKCGLVSSTDAHAEVSVVFL